MGKYIEISHEDDIRQYNDKLYEAGLVKNDIPEELWGDNYNCWGLTAFLKGWIPNEVWLYNERMQELLKEHTTEITKPKVGDIVVFAHKNGRLVHTSILVDTKKQLILQKRGSNILSINTIRYTLANIYPKTKKVYYVREVGREMK